MTDFNFSVSTCPCCIPSTIVAVVFLCWIFTKSCNLIAQCFLSNSSVVTKGLGCLLYITNVLVVLVAIFMGALISSSSARDSFFAFLCSKMTQSPDLDPMRCGLVGNISGRVLEFGFGPGTNFRCWKNAAITEWVGVDPNTHFADTVATQKLERNLTFPSSVVWLKGENVDVEPGSFDVVVATHTLCSVTDVGQVLRQISRALKPGGTFYFMEHVAAPKGSTLRYVQQLLSPFFSVIGNGCQFRELWKDISASNFESGLETFDIVLDHVEAPIKLPPLVPHIVGTAKKHLNIQSECESG